MCFICGGGLQSNRRGSAYMGQQAKTHGFGFEGKCVRIRTTDEHRALQTPGYVGAACLVPERSS